MIKARQMSPDECRQLLQLLYSKAGDSPKAKAARSLHENMGLILHRQKAGLDVLVPDSLLTALYETGHLIISAYPQLFNIIDCLGHANPTYTFWRLGPGQAVQRAW